jgi:transposase
MLPVRKINPWGRRTVSLGGVKLTLEEKTWLIHEVHYHGVQGAELSRMYSMKKNRLNKWVLKYKNTGKITVDTGRPSLLSSPEYKEFKAQLNKEDYNQTDVEFKDAINKKHKDSVMSQSNIAGCSIPDISARSLNRIKEKLGLKDGNAEQTTNARAVATADQLNAVSTAVAHYLMMPLTSPHITINSDGTSFMTAGSSTSSVKVVFDPEEQRNRGIPLKVLPVLGAKLTAHFVKFYMCINATGTSAAPIYIIADENMAEGEIDVHEVPGLGLGTGIADIGYVVFAKTRSVNEKFYEWWFTKILTKFAIDLRCRYNIPNDVPVYFCLDGEDTQLKPLKTAEIVELCKEHNIIIGKPPASTTSITQACDAGKIFMAPKTKKKHLKTIGECLEHEMTKLLNKVMKAHEVKVGKKMKDGKAKAAVEGLQVVQYILQTTLRKDMIVNSFEIIGQYDAKTGKCDVERILRQCRTKFTQEQITKVWELLPSLCKKMMEKGELSEEDYMPLGFGSTSATYKKSKDDLVLNRRRFVFLTNPALIQKENDKRVAKENDVILKLDSKNKRKLAAEAKKLLPPAIKRAKKNAVVVPDIFA